MLDARIRDAMNPLSVPVNAGTRHYQNAMADVRCARCTQEPTRPTVLRVFPATAADLPRVD
jgi:hypothetical protein